MPRFIIEVWMDGYDSKEEMEEACVTWIEEQLDSSGTSVKIIKKLEDGETDG